MVDGSPAQVRERLQERLCPVKDLWFPTRRELRAWDEDPAPLYVRSLRPDRVEVGLHLETMAAARLTPALRTELTDAGLGRTTLRARLAWPRVTLLLLWGFTAGVAAWGASLGYELWTGQTHAGWLVAWVSVPLTVHVGAWFAWYWGRSQLLAELPWLRQALSRPVVEGEDWG